MVRKASPRKRSTRTKRDEDGARLRRRRMQNLLHGGLLLLLAGLILTAYFAYDLPSVGGLSEVKKTPSVIVRASGGDIIGSYGDIYGEYLAYPELPKPLVRAVLATEDRNFFSHGGIDLFGIARAMLANLKAGHIVQGGSTITQQVAKNIFLTPDRTLKRKVQEMLLAFWLEARYSKEEILSIYLNRVYLGAGNYGVDAASKRYFGKPAKQMDLNEAAVLAGMLKAPSRYAPTSNPKLARKRAEQVLLNMMDAGYLTEAQVRASLLKFPKAMINRNAVAQNSMYFGDWIVEQLPEFVGNSEADLEVDTTLDVAAQTAAEKALATAMDAQGDKLGVHQAALLSMSPDGAVKALLGGRHYPESQYNRATQAKRQPGSSFKLFVYLAGMEAGYSPDSVFEDAPVAVGNWMPKNYTGEYQGPMALRDALAQSINTVAVQLSEASGRQNVVNMAERLGITSQIQANPSVALGTDEVTLLELVTAYAHLASNGKSVFPYGILRIRAKDGTVLYTREATPNEQVLNANIVGMMNSMLQGVVQYGTGTRANIGRPMAGKTGTTSDYKDAWFIGYTPDLVTGVWVGNDDNQQMKKVTGGSLPASIWHDYMQAALVGVPAHALPTGYTASFIKGMPWLGQEGEAAPAAPTRNSAPTEESGDSFFDRIIEGNPARGQVEYDYPEPRR